MTCKRVEKWEVDCRIDTIEVSVDRDDDEPNIWVRQGGDGILLDETEVNDLIEALTQARDAISQPST